MNNKVLTKNAVTRKIIIKEGILESVEIIYDVIARGAEK